MTGKFTFLSKLFMVQCFCLKLESIFTFFGTNICSSNLQIFSTYLNTVVSVKCNVASIACAQARIVDNKILGELKKIWNLGELHIYVETTRSSFCLFSLTSFLIKAKTTLWIYSRHQKSGLDSAAAKKMWTWWSFAVYKIVSPVGFHVASLITVNNLTL